MTIRWIEKNVCVHCPKSAAEVEAVWRRRRSFPFDYILLHNNNKEKTIPIIALFLGIFGRRN
jgi:hypothetical protein